MNKVLITLMVTFLLSHSPHSSAHVDAADSGTGTHELLVEYHYDAKTIVEIVSKLVIQQGEQKKEVIAIKKELRALIMMIIVAGGLVAIANREEIIDWIRN